jgi:hypothetical protein
MAQHVSFRLSMLLMTADAQPTPGLTLKAPQGQLRLQAPHSMHASRNAISILPFEGRNTSRGQTVRHTPQPVHLSASKARVTTSLR